MDREELLAEVKARGGVSLREFVAKDLLSLGKPDVSEGLVFLCENNFAHELQGVGGVYVISDDEGVIYVGVSKNLRRRLPEHRSLRSKGSLATKVVEDVDSDEYEMYFETLSVDIYLERDNNLQEALESLLIFKYSPRYNHTSDHERGVFNRAVTLVNEKDAVVEAYCAGEPLKEIAERYDVNPSTVSLRLRSWGISTGPTRHRYIDKEKIEFVRRHYEGKESWAALSAETGVPSVTLAAWGSKFAVEAGFSHLRKTQITHYPEAFKQSLVEYHTNNTVTTAEVSEIYGVGVSSAREWIREAKGKHSERAYSEEFKKETAYEFHTTRLSQSDVAKKRGVSKGSVKDWYAKYKHEFEGTCVSSRSRFSDSVKQRVSERYFYGEHKRDLAAEFGISETTVFDWYHKYKHLFEEAHNGIRNI